MRCVQLLPKTTQTSTIIIDDETKGQDNVVSALFADNEAAYLAGVLAAKTTKTKVVGFVVVLKVPY